MTKSAPSTLVMIDIQNDFCPGGALAVPGGDEIVPLVNAMQLDYETRILTQDWHCSGHLSFAPSHADADSFSVVTMPYGPQVLWPIHCVQGSHGAEFHPDLDITQADLIVRKGMRREIDSYSAFFENDKTTPTGLSGYLQERGLMDVTLVGLATDFCVCYSALDGIRLGFNVRICLSACRAIDLDGSLQTALDNMHKAGIELIE